MAAKARENPPGGKADTMTIVEGILLVALFVCVLWITKREADVKTLRGRIAALRAREIPAMIQGAAIAALAAYYLRRRV